MAKISITMTNFSPNIVSTATVTQASRNNTSVKLNVSISSNLRYSSSYLGSGYTITGRVTAYGINKDITLKSSSATWSGNTAHTNTTTWTITVPANVTSITIGYRLIVSGYESATATGTNQTLTLSKVLATAISSTSFTDTTNPSISFSNPSNFKIRPFIMLFTAASGGTKIGDTIYPAELPSSGDYLSSPYTWDLTETQRVAIRNAMGNRTTASATIGIDTYNGTTWLGNSKTTATFTNELSPPTFSNFTYADSNSSTIAVTGDSSEIILGYSSLTITINGNNKAVANKGATMSYYLIGETQYPYSDDFSVTIPNWDQQEISVIAVDSRGISTKVTKQPTVADYTPLEKGSITIERDGNISEETTLSYNGTAIKTLPNGNSNTITATYRYKQTDSGTYITGTTNINPTIDNDGNFSFDNYIRGDINTGFDIDNSYNIIVEIQDVLSSAQYSATINSGIPAIAVKGNNVALHGEYDESLGGTQFNGDLFWNGNPIGFADSVIEQGTQSGWNYIKWSSGKVELFGSTQNTGLKLTTASAGTYYGGGNDGVRSTTLPFYFDTVLFVGYREISARSSGIYIYDASVSGSTLTTQFRAHASSNNVSCGGSYYIVGIV